MRRSPSSNSESPSHLESPCSPLRFHSPLRSDRADPPETAPYVPRINSPENTCPASSPPPIDNSKAIVDEFTQYSPLISPLPPAGNAAAEPFACNSNPAEMECGMSAVRKVGREGGFVLKKGETNPLIQKPKVTWEGCSVLLDINDGDRLVFARLTAGSTLKIGNKNCFLRDLIGCPFGSLFQVEGGKEGFYLSRVIPSTEGNNIEEKGDCQIMDECRDNRAIVDNNKAQSLTGEEIDAMRRQGMKGDEIIEALIANSSTFEKKTSFSQEKYKIKKQKKYAPRVLVRRPCARSISEAYFKKYPARIGNLRVDTLSLLLSMANVTPNSDILILDMVGGLLTGAVAERLGGTGHVCSTHIGGTPYPMDILRIFNFNNEICKRVVRASLDDLRLCQTRASDQIDGNERSCDVNSNDQTSSVGMKKVSHSAECEIADLDPETFVSPVSQMNKSPKAGEKASREALMLWKENGFSSLIIAAPDLDPWSLVKDLLPLLTYSAPFAIYHQYLQPLSTCMHNLQLGQMAIGLQISEPWLREYQVLQSRTHPCMQMSAFGGYILSGTRICGSQ